MSNVTVVINSRAAHKHANPFTVQRLEIFNGTGQSIVYSQNQDASFPIGLRNSDGQGRLRSLSINCKTLGTFANAFTHSPRREVATRSDI